MIRNARTFAAAGLTLVVLLLVAAHPARSGSADVEPGAFVHRMVADVAKNLAGDLERRERRERFREMSGQYLALQQITRFVTGGYWGDATAAERRAFRKAFRELLRARFLPVLAKAADVRFDVAGSRRVQAGLWQVGLNVSQPGPKSETTRVGLRVMQTDAGLRVADVVTKGVSLGVTLREEYTTFLERHDGDLTALTRRVRQRARDLNG
mgnify:FL=1